MMKRLMSRFWGRYSTVVIVAVIYMLPLAFVHGGADYFLKIEGVPGESTDAKHKEWIDVASFSWGTTRAISGTGTNRVLGALEKGDLVVSKFVDKSSPSLMLGTCSGIGYPKVELSIADRSSSNYTSYLILKMSDVLVSSYQISPAGGSAGSADTRPMESLSLNFSKIVFDYYKEDSATGEIRDQQIVECNDPGGAP